MSREPSPVPLLQSLRTQRRRAPRASLNGCAVSLCPGLSCGCPCGAMDVSFSSRPQSLGMQHVSPGRRSTAAPFRFAILWLPLRGDGRVIFESSAVPWHRFYSLQRSRNMSAQGRAKLRSRAAPPWVSEPKPSVALQGHYNCRRVVVQPPRQSHKYRSSNSTPCRVSNARSSSWNVILR
jgi:hypothetical protein